MAHSTPVGSFVEQQDAAVWGFQPTAIRRWLDLFRVHGGADALLDLPARGTQPVEGAVVLRYVPGDGLASGLRPPGHPELSDPDLARVHDVPRWDHRSRIKVIHQLALIRDDPSVPDAVLHETAWVATRIRQLAVPGWPERTARDRAAVTDCCARVMEAAHVLHDYVAGALVRGHAPDQSVPEIDLPSAVEAAGVDDTGLIEVARGLEALPSRPIGLYSASELEAAARHLDLLGRELTTGSDYYFPTAACTRQCEHRACSDPRRWVRTAGALRALCR